MQLSSSTTAKQLQKHILVIISGHGYGHMAMTAPVINYIAEQHPGITFTIRTTVPEAILRNKITPAFDYQPIASDFGLVMNSAFDIDLKASLNAYRDVHAHWDESIKTEQQLLKQTAPDLLISNIAYLPLVAAKTLNIPSIAMCCLNWADIFHYYFHHTEEDKQIHQQILTAYRCADLFIRPQPAMPMASLTTQPVGALALLGNNIKPHIQETLGLDTETRLVLSSMGGIHTPVDYTNWPQLDNVHYLTAGAPLNCHRADMSHIDDLPLSFSDVLRSCDLFFTKPGYGSFAEAACYSVPVLYVHRDNWPEQPYLTDWLSRYTLCESIDQNCFAEGKFHLQLTSLISSQNTLMPPPQGTEETYRLIKQFLR